MSSVALYRALKLQCLTCAKDYHAAKNANNIMAQYKPGDWCIHHAQSDAQCQARGAGAGWRWPGQKMVPPGRERERERVRWGEQRLHWDTSCRAQWPGLHRHCYRFATWTGIWCVCVCVCLERKLILEHRQSMFTCTVFRECVCVFALFGG